jgi:transcriptional regulator
MYLPRHFEVTEWDSIKAFVARVSAVDLVTVDESGDPISTLLPCIWDTSAHKQDEYGTLIMHMAKQNEQWKSIKVGTRGLAIVHGAQAYISPTNYGNKNTDHRVVPTWNYQSVHLSGVVEVSDDVERLRGIVTSLTEFHESGRKNSWSANQADPKYMEGQLKAIVAVTMRVDRVEAKDKLSQNRPLEDRKRIVADLLSSEKLTEREVAQEMRRLVCD